MIRLIGGLQITMTFPFEHLQTEALLGWVPRHVLDVSAEAIPVEARLFSEARKAVREAATIGEGIADDLERRCHEVACIEDSDLPGAFRRLIAVAILAVDVKGRLDRGEGSARSYLVAAHRAVEERWVGASYDLSNCLATLHYLVVTKLDEGAALGTWIWLNLGAQDQSRNFRWVLSTRRFEPGLGADVLAHARVKSDGAEESAFTGALLAEQAMQIAEALRMKNTDIGVVGRPRSAVEWNDISGQRPHVYGKDEAFWRRQWIVYFEQQGIPDSNVFVVRASVIAAVDKWTGEVGYVGSANDEG